MIQQGNTDSEEGTRSKENTDSSRALRTLAQALLGACLMALAYAGYAGGREQFLAVASVSLLLLGSSALVGGTLGFLFGIPRMLQGEVKAPRATQPDVLPTDQAGSNRDSSPPPQAAPAPGSDYAANTNLEQISDWLTKILVGVGLTQIDGIKAGVISIIGYVQPALNGGVYGGPFAATLMLCGVVLGFLFGYLWTRLFLIGAFRVADRSGLENRIGLLAVQVKTATEKAEVAERQVDELKRRGQLDAEALHVIDSQLNPRSDVPAPSYQEIEKAIMDASYSVKVQIFYRARDLRSKTWRAPRSKPTMELTIPVFRALIAADTERRYHASHGQLAFALKDKEPPDDSEAEKEFTTAIDIRDKHGEGGWTFYELYRAVCRIRQDLNFSSDNASDDDLKALVLADLRHACLEEEAWQVAKNEPAIVDWCDKNSIPLTSLRDRPLRG